MTTKSSARRKPLYEGKAKIIFEGPDSSTLIQHFKDDATAFNGAKKGTIIGKGVINNRISEFIMKNLASLNIPTHFIKSLNMREQLIAKAEMLPFEVIIRNVAAGGICKRLGIKEGIVFPRPIVEFSAKSDELNDPLINEDYIYTFGWSEQIEMEELRTYALRINDFLVGLFLGVGIRLVDFKLEFGRIMFEEYEQLVVADEISPDSCRLWDIKTNEKLDKDRFRHDLGGVEEAYREVAKRLGVFSEMDDIQAEGV